jgi:hypothetical protein
LNHLCILTNGITSVTSQNMKIRLMDTYTLKRSYLFTAAILLTGFGSALIIYLTAAELPVNPFDEFEKSKKFAYELERMGGKAAIVANDLNKWFAGLWQGESLSYTVAAITVIIAAVYYFISTSLEAEARGAKRETPPATFSG